MYHGGAKLLHVTEKQNKDNLTTVKHDLLRSSKMQAKYITLHEPALPGPMDHPKDHLLPQTRPLTALA